MTDHIAEVEIPVPGALTGCTVDGTQIALANVGGQLFAFSNICTHAACELSDGDLDGMAVSCPCHLAQFDVATGAVLRPPAPAPLQTYAVRVEGGRLKIALPDAAQKG